LRGEFLCLLDAVNDELGEPFKPDGAVLALDKGVLLRLSYSGTRHLWNDDD